MNQTYYLISGNINPAFDTDKIHLDMINEANKNGSTNPLIYLFATASTGTDWHDNYVKNISDIFSKYDCQFKIIDNVEAVAEYDFSNVDIVYFLGGSPYKHSALTKYKYLFDKIPIKAGTSAGAIYLGYETFYAQKDDYLIAIPNMLNYINLHVLPHSETHKEELVFNYLVNEINIPVLKIHNQACLKIQKNDHETVNSIMGDVENVEEKIEIIMPGRYYKAEEDKTIALSSNIVNY